MNARYIGFCFLQTLLVIFYLAASKDAVKFDVDTMLIFATPVFWAVWRLLGLQRGGCDRIGSWDPRETSGQPQCAAGHRLLL